MQWLAFLASNLSSPGITLGFDKLLLTKKLQVGQLVGWSVFSRLALGHELYIEAQKKFLPHFFAFEISFT
jgi:hypothetical protein